MKDQKFELVTSTLKITSYKTLFANEAKGKEKEIKMKKLVKEGKLAEKRLSKIRENLEKKTEYLEEIKRGIGKKALTLPFAVIVEGKAKEEQFGNLLKKASSGAEEIIDYSLSDEECKRTFERMREASQKFEVIRIIGVCKECGGRIIEDFESYSSFLTEEANFKDKILIFVEVCKSVISVTVLTPLGKTKVKTEEVIR